MMISLLVIVGTCGARTAGDGNAVVAGEQSPNSSSFLGIVESPGNAGPTESPAGSCEPAKLEVQIGGHVETPRLAEGVTLLDCPKPEFRGILKVQCKGGVPNLIQETCAWETARTIIMGMKPGMVPPAVISQIHDEAKREVERLRKQSSQADHELSHVRNQLQRVAQRMGRLSKVKDETLIDMNKTDLAAVQLDKKEDEFKDTMLKYEMNLNLTKANVKIAHDAYNAHFHTANAHELSDYQEVVDTQERMLEGAQQAYNGAKDAVRTINDEQFGHQKAYAIQYHQLLDVSGDVHADESLHDNIKKMYDDYEALDTQVNADFEAEKEFSEKLTSLVTETEASYSDEEAD